MHKDLLAAAAIILSVGMYAPYIRSIHAGQTKPHAISWIIWTASTWVVFAAQWVDGAGVGAWPTAVIGLATAYVALLALRQRSDAATTKRDWVFLALAVIALPCWLATSNPLLAVVLLTGVELLGFAPTFAAAFSNPHQERTGFYLLGALRSALAIAALEHYSWTTVLFPGAKTGVAVMLVLMIGVRRLGARNKTLSPTLANHILCSSPADTSVYQRAAGARTR
jgi:hypothetical protein